MGKEIKKIQKNKQKVIDKPWQQKWEDGKELIMKVTQRLSQVENNNKVLDAQLKAAHAIIGAMAISLREHSKDDVIISKALIKEMIDKYNISSSETEDKLGFVIKVEEVQDDN